MHAPVIDGIPELAMGAGSHLKKVRMNALNLNKNALSAMAALLGTGSNTRDEIRTEVTRDEIRTDVSRDEIRTDGRD